MENNETMINEEAQATEIEATEAETKKPMGVGKIALIGAGLALAGPAAAKLAMKLVNNLKPKADGPAAEEHDFVEPTDEEIKNVVGE